MILVPKDSFASQVVDPSLKVCLHADVSPSDACRP